MHKIGQSGGFLGRFVEPSLKTILPLIRNVLKPLAKSVLKTLVLTALASATDTAIQIFGSGVTTLIILNEEMNDIMKIFKSLGKSGLLKKKVAKQLKIKKKNKKEDFLECY